MNRLRRHPILAALGVVLALLLALLGINTFDQDLRPESRELYERPARPFSRDSGWALMLGLDAPAGQDPRAYAKASAPLASRAKPRNVTVAAADSRLAVRAAAELLCAPESMDCVKEFAPRPTFVDDLAADNAELLARYDELLKAPALADVIHGVEAYDVFFPANLLLGAQRIRLSQVGAAAASGRLERALDWLEADAAFYRRWLEEAQTMLPKMLAVRGYSRSLLLAGQLARSVDPLGPDTGAALTRIAAPLSHVQRGVAIPIRSEAVLFRELLDELIANPRGTRDVTGANPFMSELASRTLRRNATLNFAAPLYSAWIDLDRIDTAALGPTIERVRAAQQLHLAKDWRWLYNYPGHALTVESAYDPGEYVYRLRDTDALGSVMRCVVALRVARATREAAAAHVATSPACIDPYEGKPLAWDDGRGELSFKPRSPKQVSRFGGRGDRVTFAVFPAS